MEGSIAYLWKVHVVCMTAWSADWTLSVAADTRDSGTQCLSPLNAVSTLLVNVANGGCCSNSIGG